MVLFCKASSSTPVTFREPVRADFLGSGSRQEYMIPKIEIPLDTVEKADISDSDTLRWKKRSKLIAAQRESAVGHWKVMRTVLPPKIWELW